MVNSDAILALIADLYQQIRALQAENATLKAKLNETDAAN